MDNNKLNYHYYLVLNTIEGYKGISLSTENEINHLQQLEELEQENSVITQEDSDIYGLEPINILNIKELRKGNIKDRNSEKAPVYLIIYAINNNTFIYKKEFMVYDEITKFEDISGLREAIIEDSNEEINNLVILNWLRIREDYLDENERGV